MKSSRVWLTVGLATQKYKHLLTSWFFYKATLVSIFL